VLVRDPRQRMQARSFPASENYAFHARDFTIG
jgi:hypothetical protein